MNRPPALHEEQAPSLLHRSLVLVLALVGASAAFVALVSVISVLVADRAVLGFRSLQPQVTEAKPGVVTAPVKRSLVSPKPNG